MSAVHKSNAVAKVPDVYYFMVLFKQENICTNVCKLATTYKDTSSAVSVSISGNQHLPES